MPPPMLASDAATIWMSRSAMKKPTHITAKANVWRVMRHSAHVNPGDNRQPGSKLTQHRCISIQLNPHRNALHNLREVASGVLSRQNAEHSARGRRQTQDPAMKDLPGQYISLDGHGLPSSHARKL